MQIGPFNISIDSVRRCPDCDQIVLIVSDPGPSADAEFEEKLAGHQGRDHA